jgi:branched-chain amino acid transport system ATP-binding protein
VQEIMRAVARLSAKGLTVLLVEQNARAALLISNYGYVLEHGKFVAEGSASALEADERLVATYLGGEVNAGAEHG